MIPYEIVVGLMFAPVIVLLIVALIKIEDWTGRW